MPFGKQVHCSKCDKKESLMWHPVDEGIQCSECLECEELALIVGEEEDQKPPMPVTVEKPKTPAKKNTRSTRSYKTRQNPYAIPKQVAPKGKGRRQIFKKTVPGKLQAAQATCITVSNVLHRGTSYKVGDVVSVVDVEGGVFYAQIRGLMIDEYCEKSASLTWLIPTRRIHDEEEFDPMAFVVGYDDDLPREMDCLQFVMHSAWEYFHNNCPQPSAVLHCGLAGCVWGRLSPNF